MEAQIYTGLPEYWSHGQDLVEKKRSKGESRNTLRSGQWGDNLKGRVAVRPAMWGKHLRSPVSTLEGALSPPLQVGVRL